MRFYRKKSSSAARPNSQARARELFSYPAIARIWRCIRQRQRGGVSHFPGVLGGFWPLVLAIRRSGPRARVRARLGLGQAATGMSPRQ